MGVSESTHSEAENLKSSFISTPAVGEIANKPGCGGLLVVIVMEDSELVEDPSTALRRVKISVAPCGNEFGFTTKLVGVVVITVS